MHLVSVNIGKEEPLANAKSGTTGIFKRPATGSVVVTKNGVVGDRIIDVANHGGLDQAVYLYGVPDYEWWQHELGRELPPGTFGENLTVSELESAGFSIGGRFLIGNLLLEIAGVRIPCITLARRMNDPEFVTKFQKAERPGLYCRVLVEGEIKANDAVVYTPYLGQTVSALALFRDFFNPQLNETAINRMLAAPIAIRTRQHKERQLNALRRQEG